MRLFSVAALVVVESVASVVRSGSYPNLRSVGGEEAAGRPRGFSFDSISSLCESVSGRSVDSEEQRTPSIRSTEAPVECAQPTSLTEALNCVDMYISDPEKMSFYCAIVSQFMSNEDEDIVSSLSEDEGYEESPTEAPVTAAPVRAGFPIRRFKIRAAAPAIYT